MRFENPHSAFRIPQSAFRNSLLPCFSWFEVGCIRHFLKQFLLFFSRMARYDNLQLHILVSAATSPLVEALTSQPDRWPLCEPAGTFISALPWRQHFNLAPEPLPMGDRTSTGLSSSPVIERSGRA
jgi:hypothetical protein